MSNTIDQRVVEMRFDNKQFEQNVQTSMSTIDKLKEGLNFNGAVKGLDGINASVKNVNMSSLGDAVETVRLKFSALQVMAVTALQDITRSVINTGKKMISSLTIDPIMAGYREYETQTNSIQTILANTQSRQKVITKEAGDSIVETATSAADAVREANKSSLDDLRDTHKQKIKEFDKLADEEVDIAEDKYEKESEALEDAIDEETESLNSAHKAKLDMYNEEYMAKLKTIDEERYNRIQTIDNQIASINKRTKAEEESIKRKEQQERLSELRTKVNEAKTIEDQMEAQKRLSDYEDDIAREKLLAKRDAKIEALEISKDEIKEEYALAEEQLKTEYQTKTEQEKEIYDLASKNLREEQDARKKALRETYDVERELLAEKQSEAKEALRELQDDEIDALNTRHDLAIKNIKEEKAAAATPVEFEMTEGSTLQDVNRALDELNAYADKTIYNFTEMTRNIGTFTAAGVDLDTSVQAIKGIANLAAVSGSNAQQASNAMYQLSQALSTGTVKLMDWNSVVNSGMGGQVFQDSLTETARIHGIAIDDMIANAGSFRATLENGWLSADILTETLSKFTGDLSEAQLKEMGYTEEQIVKIMELGVMASDAATKVKTFTQLQDTLKEAAQSGWTKSWQIIIGDFNEAKNLFTEVSDIVGKMLGDSADARNNLLSGGISSGWKQFLREGVADEEGLKEAIINMAKETNPQIEELIKQAGSFEASLKDGWLTADILSGSLETLTAKTKGLSDEELKELGYSRQQIDSLEALNEKVQNGSMSIEDFTNKMTIPSGRENIIDGLLSSFRAIVNIAKMVKDSFTEIFPPATADTLYKITEKVKELGISFEAFTSNLSSNDVETPFSNLKRTLKGVFAGLDIVFQLFKSFANFISPATSTIGDLLTTILSITASWGDWVVSLDESIKKGDKFTKAFEKIADFLKPVTDKLDAGRIAILEWFSSFGKIDTTAFENFFTISQNKLEAFAKIGEFFTNVWEGIKSIFSAISAKISPVFSAFWEDLKSSMSGVTLDDIINGILSFLTGGAIVAITKMVNALKDIFKDAAGFFEGINEILEGIKGVLKAYQNEINAKALMKIAIAVALLVASLIALTFVDPEKLLNATIAISTLLAELIGATKILDKLGGQKGFKGLGGGVTAMIAMASAVLILSFALKNVADLDTDKLTNGFWAITGVIAAVVGAMILMSKFSGTVKTSSAGFIALAIAILMLSKVVKAFSEMDPVKLAFGLGGLTLIVAELVGFMIAINKTDMTFKKGASFMALAKAVKMLAAVVVTLGTLDPDALIRGVGAVGVLMAGLAAFVIYTDKTSGIEKKAAGILAIAAALLIMSLAVKLMGGMSPDEIAKGLIAIGGAMLVLVVGLNYMKGTTGGSAALLVAAFAIGVLTPALMLLGTMSWEAIIKGLVALAGTFVILGVAGALLGPIAPVILMLAGALALVGVGILAMGIGLVAAGTGLISIAAGIAALAVAGAAGAYAFVESLKIILTGMLELVPLMADIAKAWIKGICDVLIASAPVMLETFKVLVLSFIDAFVFLLPSIVEGVFQLVVSLLEKLVEYSPKIISLLFDFLINLFNGLAERMPELIQAAFNLFKAIFEGVVAALEGMNTDTLTKGLVGIGIIAAIIVALSALAPLIPAAMLGVLGVGGIVAEMAALLAAFGALAQIPGLLWIIGEGGTLLEAIGVAIGQFIGGIAGGIMSGVSSQFPQIGSDLSAFMINAGAFIEGAGKISQGTMDGVLALVGAIVALTAANVVNGLTSWFTGGTSMVEFGKELAEFGPYFAQYYESVKNIKGPVVESSAYAAKALAEMANLLPEKGGVAGWFTGESGSLSEFAAELVLFGPKLMEYAGSVEGLKSDVVINSANAAKALFEMDAKLPKAGGVVGWFTGTSGTLSEFAAELVLFGPSLKKYADSVSGLDPAVVTNSANAASALFELDAKLSKTGGLVGWITGEKGKLSEFGAELALFGPSLKVYADSIANLDPAVVTASTNAGLALAGMATTIPNSGGFVSLFTGDNNISTFGDNLALFGESFKEYYGSISDIKPAQLNAVIDEVSELVVIAQDMSKLKTDGMKKFGESLEKLGNTGIARFIAAFTGSIDAVKVATDGMLKAVTDELDAKKKEFVEKFKKLMAAVTDALASKDQKKKFSASGETLMKSFTEGITTEDKKTKLTATEKSFVNIIAGIITAINNRRTDFYNSGILMMNSLVNGMKSSGLLDPRGGKNGVTMSTAIQAIMVAALDNLNKVGKGTVRQAFYDTGTYCAQGFVNGIGSKNTEVTAAANIMAATAIIAANKTLLEKSPSKVFFGIGAYAGQGFVNGLDSYGTKTYTAGEDMADSAKKGLSAAIAKISDFLSGDMDTTPTIRPVMDLTNIQNGKNQLYRMMQDVDGYAMSGSVGIANNTANSMTQSLKNKQLDVTPSAIDLLKKTVQELITNPPKAFENNFYITSDNPEEVADEVSRVIQLQVERTDALWA